jgi:ribonuclease P protein subunit RPR2
MPRPSKPKQLGRLSESKHVGCTMAKSKGVPNRHLHARATFLYQAATYLTLQAKTQQSKAASPGSCKITHQTESQGPSNRNMVTSALQLGSHLRSVSMKGQIRLSSNVKRSVCKTCDAILVPGHTSTHTIENKSKGGRKPWADVLEVRCNLCGAKKRFPFGATRQKKKSQRNANKETRSSQNASVACSPNAAVFPESKQGATIT